MRKGFWVLAGLAALAAGWFAGRAVFGESRESPGRPNGPAAVPDVPGGEVELRPREVGPVAPSAEEVETPPFADPEYAERVVAESKERFRRLVAKYVGFRLQRFQYVARGFAAGEGLPAVDGSAGSFASVGTWIRGRASELDDGDTLVLLSDVLRLKERQELVFRELLAREEELFRKARAAGTLVTDFESWVAGREGVELFRRSEDPAYDAALARLREADRRTAEVIVEVLREVDAPAPEAGSGR